jgi:D-beta-D-heptose 7-phosphate kinase/D-beta-D-heptose 1-phosphate adenosyltransferase
MWPEPYPGPVSLDDLLEERARWREEGRRVVFTNGCFDLLHAGHVDLLQKARALGDLLVVGLNDDDSLRRAKGEGRPLLPLEERAEVLQALECVDRVVAFGEDTPARLLEALVPDVLVKGADWPADQIVGRETVEAAGGRVERVELREGRSTTGIIGRVRGE